MHHEALIGQILDDHYKIVASLGSGGMAMVFKAEQLGLKRFVAIKIMHISLLQDKDSQARFEREAAALSTLSHRNIALFYSYGLLQPSSPTFPANFNQPLPYIVMEFLQGPSLREVINKEGKFPWKRSVSITKQICDAMEYAHKSQIIHRDIKPNNIILLDQPSPDFVKIVDFGLAKVVNLTGDTVQKLTQTGSLLGSVSYMSPEQCQGQKADKRSDIYALGCVFYELLCGEPPHDADNPIGLMHKHVNEIPSSLSGKLSFSSLPHGLEECLFKALAKDPDKRYQTMQQFAEDLKLVEQGKGATCVATQEGHEGKSQRKKVRFSRQNILLTVSSILVIGLTLCVILLTTNWGLHVLTTAVLKTAPWELKITALTDLSNLMEQFGKEEAAQEARIELANYLSLSKTSSLAPARAYLEFAHKAYARGNRAIAVAWTQSAIQQVLNYVLNLDPRSSAEWSSATEILSSSARIMHTCHSTLPYATILSLRQSNPSPFSTLNIIRDHRNSYDFLRLVYESALNLHLKKDDNLKDIAVSMAISSLNNGKLQESLAAYAFAKSIMEHQLSKNDPEIAIFEIDQARSLKNAEQVDATADLIADAQRIIDSPNNDKAKKLLGAMRYLRAYYAQYGPREKALKLAEQEYDLTSKLTGYRSLSTIDTLPSICDLLINQNPKKALFIAKHALDLFQKTESEQLGTNDEINSTFYILMKNSNWGPSNIIQNGFMGSAIKNRNPTPRAPLNSPEFIHLSTSYINALLRNGFPEQALSEYIKLTTTLENNPPKHVIDWIELRCYPSNFFRDGYYGYGEKAWNAYRSLVEHLGNDDVTAQMHVAGVHGELLQGQGYFDNAEKEYRRALDLSRSLSDEWQGWSLLNLLMFYKGLGMVQKQDQILQKLLVLPQPDPQLNSYQCPVYSHIFHSALRRKDEGEAIIYLGKLRAGFNIKPLQRWPTGIYLSCRADYAKAHGRLAEEKKYRQAEEQLHEKLKDDISWDHYSRALVSVWKLSEQGKNAEAEVIASSAFSSIKSHIPKSFMVILNGGLCLEFVLIRQGKYIETERIAHELIQDFDNKITYPSEKNLLMCNRIMLTNALLKQGKFEQADHELERIEVWLDPEKRINIDFCRDSVLALCKYEIEKRRLPIGHKLAKLLLNNVEAKEEQTQSDKFFIDQAKKLLSTH